MMRVLPLVLHRIATLAFPRAFRRRWGVAMRGTFESSLREARGRGRGAVVRFTLRELHTTILAGFGERLHADPRQLRMLHLQDIRYAVRLLTRSPGFTLITVLVLGGGLGLATFTFSFLYTAMFKPLPLSEGERIVRVFMNVEGRTRGVDAFDVAPLRTAVPALQSVVAFRSSEFLLGDATCAAPATCHGGPRRVIGMIETDPSIFGVARVPAMLGRTLLPSEGDPGAEAVMVLSYRAWDVAFGADRGVIDRDVTINGARVRIVGVMPKGYGFPVAGEAWVPLPPALSRATEAGRARLDVLARLAPGVTAKQASTEAAAVLQRAVGARDTARRSLTVGATVESLPSAQFGEERELAFGILNGIAGLILLLALVNVTNLLLARANERTRETAVRMALGASTPRLVMQGLWESVLLCLAGGIVGTAGASWGLDAITRWTQARMQENLAFWWVWQMDGMTLAASGGFVTLAMVTLGIVVSRRATRTNVREVLQDGSARSGSRHEGRLSRVLVATQVATLTLLLFFGVLSGIMARRFVNLDAGFDVSRLLQVAVDPTVDGDTALAARHGVLQRLRAAVAERAEFELVLLRRGLARARSSDAAVKLRGPQGTVPVATPWVYATLGDPAATDVRVSEGRLFQATDDATQPPVALVSRAFAEEHWAGRSPLGMQVQLNIGGDSAWRTVAGVVTDVPYGDPWARERSASAIYVPLLQSNVDGVAILARHRGDLNAARDGIYQAFAAVDPDLIPGQAQAYAEIIAKMRLMTIGVARLFAAAFAFALLLAVAGSYALMSRSIGLRTREVGVRRALGASDGMVTRLLLRDGGRQLGVGALVAAPIVGVVGAAFNYYLPVGVWPTVAAAVLVPLSIVGVVLAATWVPTRRVLRIAPRDALWRE